MSLHCSDKWMLNGSFFIVSSFLQVYLVRTLQPYGSMTCEKNILDWYLGVWLGKNFGRADLVADPTTREYKVQVCFLYHTSSLSYFFTCHRYRSSTTYSLLWQSAVVSRIFKPISLSIPTRDLHLYRSPPVKTSDTFRICWTTTELVVQILPAIGYTDQRT